MSFVLRYLCVVACAIILSSAWCHCEETTPSKAASLSEIVFIGLRPVKDLDPLRYPKERRLCVQNYLAAIAPGSYLWKLESPIIPERLIIVRRAALTEQMVVILGPQVRAEAETFTSAMPLMTEWEGTSEGPIDEANFVDNWLEKRPMTPIAPFLYLLKAHRLRAGYEAARVRGEKNLWPILAKRYREALNVAKSSSNPLISCIADDLDAQPFVYLEGQGMP